MEIPRIVDMMKTLYYLSKDRRDKTASERLAFAGFDKLVEVAFHGLEDEVELLGVWKEEEVVERDDVRVIGYRS